jgi:hypothetical protein
MIEQAKHSLMIFEEIADMLRIKVSAVKRMTEARAQSRPNHIPCFKIGGRIKFLRVDIMRWREKVQEAERAKQEAKAAVPKGKRKR